MKRTIAALVSLILALTGLVVGAGTATAQPTVSIDLVVGDQGNLIGKGAVATVPVEVTCAFSGNFLFSEGFAILRQAQGHRLVTADGGIGLSAQDCDGTPSSFEFTFFPSEAPFKSGVAVIFATISLCASDPDTGQQACTGDTEEPKEIRLKN
jgi:hypothetical protein